MLAFAWEHWSFTSSFKVFQQFCTLSKWSCPPILSIFASVCCTVSKTVFNSVNAIVQTKPGKIYDAKGIIALSAYLFLSFNILKSISSFIKLLK